MHIEDIQNPALKQLFEAAKHASGPILADAQDALEESTDDEELVHNWQSRLDSLYNECQHFWGELELKK